MQENLETKIDALLKKGLEAKDDNGRTALLLACEAGNFDMAKGLLQKGANVNARDNSGRTPLMVALEKGQVDFAIMLIGAGANTQVLLNSKILTLEFLRSHPEFVIFMVTGGNTAETLGVAQTMSFATLATDANAMNAFIEAGGVTPGSPESYQCFAAAAETGNLTAIDLLLKQNPQADLRYRNEKNETLLMVTCRNKNEDAALKVYEKLVDHFAWQCRQKYKKETEQDMKNRGEEPNQKKVEAETENKTKLAIKAFVNEKNNDGKTAADISIKEGHYELTFRLMKDGATFDPATFNDLPKEEKEKMISLFQEKYPGRNIEEFFSNAAKGKILDLRSRKGYPPKLPIAAKNNNNPNDAISQLREKIENKKTPEKATAGGKEISKTTMGASKITPLLTGYEL